MAIVKEMTHQLTWATPARGGPHSSTSADSSTVKVFEMPPMSSVYEAPIDTPMPTWKKNGRQYMMKSAWALNHARRAPESNVRASAPPPITHDGVRAK